MDDPDNVNGALARLADLRLAHLENISSLLEPSRRLFEECDGTYIEATSSQLKLSRSTLYSIDRIMALLGSDESNNKPSPSPVSNSMRSNQDIPQIRK